MCGRRGNSGHEHKELLLGPESIMCRERAMSSHVWNGIGEGQYVVHGHGPAEQRWWQLGGGSVTRDLRKLWRRPQGLGFSGVLGRPHPAIGSVPW